METDSVNTHFQFIFNMIGASIKIKCKLKKIYINVVQNFGKHNKNEEKSRYM